jgi:pimeloyl-ACP methyl ester carboxylesterase
MGQEVSVVNNFLFPATNSSYTAEQFAHHLAWLPVEGTPDPAVVLLLPYPHARYTILYMHGNGEDLGLIHAFIEVLQSRFQVSFCCVEYPGYGVADGSANELSVNRVVETAFQFLTKTLKIPEETIVIMGRSIGTGPSIACAVRHSNVAGLICMSAFSSISDMVDKVAGNFVSIFVSNRFDSIGIISKVKCPVLFLHGKADEIIPYTHSGT